MPAPLTPIILNFLFEKLKEWIAAKAKAKPSRGHGHGRTRKPRGLLSRLLPGGGVIPIGMFFAVIGVIVGCLGTGKIGQWFGREADAIRNEFVTGPIRVYFTNPNGDPADVKNIAHACAGYIDAARQTIDVAAYELDNKVVVEALVRARQRGVEVRLVTDSDYIHDYGPTALKAAGIGVEEDHRSALMHDKFMVFDKKAVWTGSVNFTENCMYKNDNHGVYLESPQLAENYSTKFRWMYEMGVFGGAPRGEVIPNPHVRFTDGTVVENYFSTHDHVADHVISIIGESQKKLDFLAFSYTHDGIGRAMLDRRAAGVAIRGVFEKSQAANNFSEYRPFRQAGLPVFLDANPRNMHHKAILIDDSVVICGSFNFSANADKSNDENILVIRSNPDVVKAFSGEFDRVYGLARDNDGK